MSTRRLLRSSWINSTTMRIMLCLKLQLRCKLIFMKPFENHGLLKFLALSKKFNMNHIKYFYCKFKITLNGLEFPFRGRLQLSLVNTFVPISVFNTKGCTSVNPILKNSIVLSLLNPFQNLCIKIIWAFQIFQ